MDRLLSLKPQRPGFLAENIRTLDDQLPSTQLKFFLYEHRQVLSESLLDIVERLLFNCFFDEYELASLDMEILIVSHERIKVSTPLAAAPGTNALFPVAEVCFINRSTNAQVKSALSVNEELLGILH